MTKSYTIAIFQYDCFNDNIQAHFFSEISIKLQ